jgi:hypothetical protein
MDTPTGKHAHPLRPLVFDEALPPIQRHLKEFVPFRGRTKQTLPAKLGVKCKAATCSGQIDTQSWSQPGSRPTSRPTDGWTTQHVCRRKSWRDGRADGHTKSDHHWRGMKPEQCVHTAAAMEFMHMKAECPPRTLSLVVGVQYDESICTRTHTHTHNVSQQTDACSCACVSQNHLAAETTRQVWSS